ncbi:MAG TPA: hypothetical protein VFH51_09475 [Myxococcota bacterium]|nr:hypothetical protein [Myxococcota bacterium]
MSGIELSEAGWPLVVMHWPERYADEDVQSAMADLVALTEQERPFAVLCDLTRAGVPSPRQRLIITQAIRANNVALGRFVKGIAMLITALPVRSAVNGMVATGRSPFPFRAFSSREDAETWSWAVLEEARAAERRRLA